MADRSLADWLAYLETIHPKAIELGLDRIRRVAAALDLLPAQIPTVTIAGTNGKGTCIAALDALLSATGKRIGRYTSPHLIAFNERISLAGSAATDAEILEAFDTIERARGSTTLSYFEFATLAALVLFRSRGMDMQLLEVGLGGRLDAANIIDADACVITSIGLDHTEWLGDTRELIAPEKAGVARSGCPAVVAEEDPPGTLLPALEAAGARTLLVGRDWHLRAGEVELRSGIRYPLPASGALMHQNLAAALVVLDAMGIQPTAAQVAGAWQQIEVPGRRQRVAYHGRELWFDVAHNRESVAALFDWLEQAPTAGDTHAVFGAMADKPLHDMIARASGQISHWHLPTHAGVPRAAAPRDLKALVADGSVACYDAPGAAWAGVMAASRPGDRIVVFGSFITVGAQMEQFIAARGAK